MPCRACSAAVDCAAVVVLKREEMKIRLFECKGLALGEGGDGDVEEEEGRRRRRPGDDATGKSALSAVASVGVTGAQGASAAVRRYLVLAQAMARNAKADATAAAAAAAASPAAADAPAGGSVVAAVAAADAAVTAAPTAAAVVSADAPSAASDASASVTEPTTPPPSSSSSSSMSSVLPHLVRDGCILLSRLLTDDDLTAHVSCQPLATLERVAWLPALLPAVHSLPATRITCNMPLPHCSLATSLASLATCRCRTALLVRLQASKAYNYARVLAGEGMLQLLLSALRQYTSE